MIDDWTGCDTDVGDVHRVARDVSDCVVVRRATRNGIAWWVRDLELSDI